MHPALFRAIQASTVKLASEKPRAEVAKHRLALFKALRNGSPVKIKMDQKADQYGGGYFDLQKKEIGLSGKDFAILAHEVGHADVDKHVTGKILQHHIVRRAFFLTPLAAMGAGMLLAKGKKWGIALPLLTAVPTLVSEGWATHEGRKRLEDLHATVLDKDYYKSVTRPGFASYAANAAVGAILGGVTGALLLRKPSV